MYFPFTGKHEKHFRVAELDRWTVREPRWVECVCVMMELKGLRCPVDGESTHTRRCVHESVQTFICVWIFFYFLSVCCCSKQSSPPINKTLGGKTFTWWNCLWYFRGGDFCVGYQDEDDNKAENVAIAAERKLIEKSLHVMITQHSHLTFGRRWMMQTDALSLSKAVGVEAFVKVPENITWRFLFCPSLRLSGVNSTSNQDAVL